MFDPDGANILHGESLRYLVEEVRTEFFARAYQGSGGDPEASSARGVTIDVYDRLSIDAQVAITADLVRANEQLVLDGDPTEIFATADTARAYIGDLICEIVHRELMRDPLVAMENENRQTPDEASRVDAEPDGTPDPL